MRTHNIPPCYRKIKEILIMPPDLALLSTLIGSNYPCLELIFMVPQVFEPLKFDCIYISLYTGRLECPYLPPPGGVPIGAYFYDMNIIMTAF